ncbi:unnamed protein product [Ambrosiozyma monospora]|uniref:Mediator of RNA polymerase II transcription subunit 11 n=1 Tax=Ambrosiozyma monospora TaxID=43982 RepID=A0A9W6YT10_AMBMO|nr:unnamed protein product [Ambrosiozyma monospora]
MPEEQKPQPQSTPSNNGDLQYIQKRVDSLQEIDSKIVSFIDNLSQTLTLLKQGKQQAATKSSAETKQKFNESVSNTYSNLSFIATHLRKEIKIWDTKINNNAMEESDLSSLNVLPLQVNKKATWINKSKFNDELSELDSVLNVNEKELSEYVKRKQGGGANTTDTAAMVTGGVSGANSNAIDVAGSITEPTVKTEPINTTTTGTTEPIDLTSASAISPRTSQAPGSVSGVALGKSDSLEIMNDDEPLFTAKTETGTGVGVSGSGSAGAGSSVGVVGQPELIQIDDDSDVDALFEDAGNDSDIKML